MAEAAVDDLLHRDRQQQSSERDHEGEPQADLQPWPQLRAGGDAAAQNGERAFLVELQAFDLVVDGTDRNHGDTRSSSTASPPGSSAS